MLEDIEVIIADSDIIYNSLADNCPHGEKIISVTKNIEEFLLKSTKIDLLIVDKEVDLLPYIHKIRSLISLIPPKARVSFRHELYLPKPLRLNDLVDIILKNRNSANLFANLSSDVVYNEASLSLEFGGTKIKFTEKENELFKYLFLARNKLVTKDELMTKVWNYHKNSESTTVNTHLYRLKNKLPKGMIEIKDNACKLIVNEANGKNYCE